MSRQEEEKAERRIIRKELERSRTMDLLA